ncbi:DNA-binding protein [Lacrimispora sp. BS-2]|uniref:DNA-binding protein n=1 Tax=Lacrimispora sp. BS-2 TaxID=3151850 RepID=A0AAU7PT64_9FIRM
MEYISVKEAAKQWGLTPRMVDYHCTDGRINGAQKIAGVWLIPRDAPRPEDGRRRNGRKTATKDKEREL